MANFCTKCGGSLAGAQNFCPHCGAPIQTIPVQKASVQTMPVQPVYQQVQPTAVGYAGNGPVRLGIPMFGFSDRVNDPEILAAVKKSKRFTKGFALFLIPLPIIVLLIYSKVTGDMDPSDALKYGAIIAAVFLVFTLYGMIKSSASKSYEATVIDKRSREVRNRGGDDDDDDDTTTEYTTVVQTTDGKKKSIVELDNGRVFAWPYLKVGDRFRYHPQFAFPYEKYDKANAGCIYCVGCQTKNPVEADRCKKCNLPLLK